MINRDTRVTPANSRLEIAEITLQSANMQIELCTQAISNFGPKVRSIAMQTIDVLLSNPTQSDIDRRKREVVEQYSKLLVDFSRNMENPIKKLNSSWMTVEQNMGFFLLSSGRNVATEPVEIRRLIDAMTGVQQKVPLAKLEIANLSDAVKGSAGGLHELEDSIEVATTTLDKLSDELSHGYAIFGRQIALAEQLYELVVEN